jgi:hypothetical protein
MFSFSGFARNGSFSSVFLCAVFAVGCENVTTSPLCTSENSIESLPGSSGQYSLAIQDQDYNVAVTEFEVTNSTNSISLKSASLDEQGVLCSWQNGWTVAQQKDADTGGYKYSRVSVTSTGMSWQPIVFDRAGLNAAGIPTTIIKSEGHQLLSKLPLLQSFGTLGLSDSINAMIIDNSNTDWRSVTKFSHSSPGGLILVRK